MVLLTQYEEILLTRTLPLSKNAVAIVDDVDYPELSKYKWHLTKSGYAGRSVYTRLAPRKYRNHTVFMHRVVNGTPEGFETDHINRDRLDNRRANLRTSTLQANLQNKSAYKNNTSGHKGVMWYARYGKWVARISIGVKTKHLGYFESVDEAAKAYKTAAALVGRT